MQSGKQVSTGFHVTVRSVRTPQTATNMNWTGPAKSGGGIQRACRLALGDFSVWHHVSPSFVHAMLAVRAEKAVNVPTTPSLWSRA